jgi:hypothetical protein
MQEEGHRRREEAGAPSRREKSTDRREGALHDALYIVVVYRAKKYATLMEDLGLDRAPDEAGGDLRKLYV